MACLLVVDEDERNARLLSESLGKELGPHYQIEHVQNLSAYRQWRRQHTPDLILVELMRQTSNGFSLAAALARQTRVPVVLLSDREQVSDKLWAAARGIHHVLSRCRGPGALAGCVAAVLAGAQGASVAPDCEAQPGDPSGSSGSVIRELTTDPAAALSDCLHEELTHCTPDSKNSPWVIATHTPEKLKWLKNIRCFINRPQLDRVVSELVMQGISNSEAWFRSRERVLLQTEPDPVSLLHHLVTDLAADIYQQLQDSPTVLESTALRSTASFPACQQLLHALSFVPAARIDPALYNEGFSVTGLTVWEFIESVESQLARSRKAECRQRAPEGSNHQITLLLRNISQQAANANLLELCLMLTTLMVSTGMLPAQMLHAPAVSHPWQRLLEACLSERYLRTYRYASQPSQPSLPSQPSQDLRLQPESSAALAEYLTTIECTLVSGKSVHQRLSGVMVQVYRMQAHLLLIRAESGIAAPSLWRWQVIAASLYRYCCCGVLQSGLLTEPDIKLLSELVDKLRHCASEGVSPPQRLMMNMAAAEVSAGRRSLYGDGQEHQLLATGLHRLPKPDGIMTALSGDVRLSGSALSEIRLELSLLTDGARRLGVARVESLSRLMLDCYEQLSRQPELLQYKNVRLGLGRAHRVLCHLLDQAAAWLLLDGSGIGSSVRRSIQELFVLFPQSKRHFSEIEIKERSARGRNAEIAAWTHCESINSQLRQLLRQRGNLHEYRSLMTELLRDQQNLIKVWNKSGV